MVEEKKLKFFEKYLIVSVSVCIAVGILLGKIAQDVAIKLDSLSVYNVSIPIALCLFFMVYPIMVKIDFSEMIKAAKTPKPVGLTLVMVAINSLTMLFLCAPLGGVLLGVNAMPIPWQTILLSVGIYVALPLIAGYVTRKCIINSKRIEWFNTKFLHRLTPVSIVALLITLILLFSFKGDIIVSNPLTIIRIAIPLFIQTVFIFSLGYFILARVLKLSYHDAAPSAMIGASNHFEVAIATATKLFGLSSGAALATVVGVLIEVPLMLWLVNICKKYSYFFKN